MKLFPVSLCVLTFSLIAPAGADAPLVGRPRDHFYNVVGERVRIEMSAQPTSLRVEDEILLVVRVIGADSVDQIHRPDLRLLDEFASRFHIEDRPDDGPDPGLARGERTFRYRLRPKNERVTEIPPLLFRYWQPRLQYFAATAPEAAISLTVRPRETSEATGLPLEGPEFLFQVRGEASLLAKTKPPRVTWTTLAVLFGPVPICIVWYLFWSATNPDAAKLAQARRSRAVRLALDELQRMRRPFDAASAGRVAQLVRHYLHDRFAMSLNAVTPAEVARQMLRLGLPKELVEGTVALLRECDAVHFGPPGASSDSLADDAEQLILQLEEATCSIISS